EYHRRSAQPARAQVLSYACEHDRSSRRRLRAVAAGRPSVRAALRADRRHQRRRRGERRGDGRCAGGALSAASGRRDLTSERALPRLPPQSGLYAALRAAVNAEIAGVGRPRDASALYAKIAVIGAGTVACYAAYLALSGPIVLLLTVPFGLLLAA